MVAPLYAFSIMFTLLIKKKSHPILVAEWCYMCKHDGESIDHLFLHCEVATEIWSVILQLFGVAWVMPHRIVSVWEVGEDMGNHLVLHIWRLAPLCVM
jgi:hypothetical protein